MKIASMRQGRDGRLILVNSSLTKACDASDIALTLQAALDNWSSASQKLQDRAAQLESEKITTFPFDPTQLHSPLPRAYQWLDGSAYLNHVELVRKARGAEMPKEFLTDPLMYQGCSDSFLAPTDPILMASEEYGIDFESEVAVVVDDVRMGISPEEALKHIKLIMLVNDVSLRNLIPAELGKGFGFLVSKPASAFSPVAVTPESLGSAWKEGKLHLPLTTKINDKHYGSPNAGLDMQFHFGQLIAHAAQTRHLCAGTIIGSGTVSNRNPEVGSSCLQEIRMIETIANGKPSTPFLRFGDRVEISMSDSNGKSIFGSITNTVKKYEWA